MNKENNNIVEELLKDIKAFDKTIKLEGQEIIDGQFTLVVLGPTRVGKTSLIQILSKSSELEIVQENGVLQIDGNGIGDTIKSETSVPVRYKLIKYLENGNQFTLYIYDTPGFGENRDFKQKILNGYWIHKLFCENKKVKLLYLLSYEDFMPNSKHSATLQSLYYLSQTFKDITNIQEKICYAFSQVNQNINQDDIKGRIYQRLSNQQSDQYFTQEVRVILQQIVDSRQLLLFKKPIQISKDSYGVFDQYRLLEQQFLPFIDQIPVIEEPKTKLTIGNDHQENEVQTQIVPYLKKNFQEAIQEFKDNLLSLFQAQKEEILNMEQDVYKHQKQIKHILHFSCISEQLININCLDNLYQELQKIAPEVNVNIFQQIAHSVNQIDFFNHIEELQETVNRDICLPEYKNVLFQQNPSLQYFEQEQFQSFNKYIIQNLQQLQQTGLKELQQLIFTKNLNTVQFIGLCNSLTQNFASYNELIQHYNFHYFYLFEIKQFIEIQEIMKNIIKIYEQREIIKTSNNQYIALVNQNKKYVYLQQLIFNDSEQLLQQFKTYINQFKQDLVDLIQQQFLYVRDNSFENKLPQSLKNNIFLQVPINQQQFEDNNINDMNYIYINQDSQDLIQSIHSLQEIKKQKILQCQKFDKKILELQRQLYQNNMR